MSSRSKPLIIVESPTKAKTITRFLEGKFNVESSNGHVRDLPKGKMGIDLEHDFQPRYVIPTRTKKRVNELKRLAQTADIIYFATDEDREGEAISWHLATLFDLPAEKIQRIVFHEITKEAITDALAHPRSLDLHLVNAQQTRRILDRLVGYELSPFLWRKISKGLSAGRVQSVALRLIVEREREIQDFKSQEYWTIEGEFQETSGKKTLRARLQKIHGKSLGKFDLKNQTEAEAIVHDLPKQFLIESIEKKKIQRGSPPPFITSTLQQEANRKLGFSTKQTMVLAQQLYEGITLGKKGTVGLITYMRTDSIQLSERFTNDARTYIQECFGPDFLPPSPKVYRAKSKLAQEAHEAIRPTDVRMIPKNLEPFVEPVLLKLYTLIWKRAVACQMTDAILQSTTLEITDENRRYTFVATGSLTTFPGFLAVEPRESKEENLLPSFEEGERLESKTVTPLQHFTEPPTRYSEAGLVKKLEEYGIGRPSTYAPTISTIVERGYVTKERRRLQPREIGMLVNDVLVQHFPEIVDFQFTAKMEDNLDAVAEGKKEWVPVIEEFYTPFKQHLNRKEEGVSKKDLTEEATQEQCERCGKPMVIKLGRYGKFLACTGFPECKNTKPWDLNGSELSSPAEKMPEQTCDLCEAPMVFRQGRFGAFLGCSRYPECKGIKRIDRSTGVYCPACKKGEIVERRSRKGKSFYSCNTYPNCQFALWSKPTGRSCPESGHLMIHGKGGSERCSDSSCRFERELPTP